MTQNLLFVKKNKDGRTHIVISKKVSEKAVVRNRIKRRVRAACGVLKKQGVSCVGKTIAPSLSIGTTPLPRIVEELKKELARFP